MGQAGILGGFLRPESDTTAIKQDVAAKTATTILYGKPGRGKSTSLAKKLKQEARKAAREQVFQTLNTHGGTTVSMAGQNVSIATLLSGTGTINGNVIVRNGASMPPGHSPGVSNVTGGNLLFAPGSTYIVEIDDYVDSDHPNEKEVAGALDAIHNDGREPDLGDDLDDANDTVTAAMRQLHGEAYASAKHASSQMQRSFVRQLSIGANSARCSASLGSLSRQFHVGKVIRGRSGFPWISTPLGILNWRKSSWNAA